MEDEAAQDVLLGNGSSLDATAAEVLRLRAESLAQEAETDELKNMIGILLFRLGEEWYSVRVDDVREIFQEYAITPIPCVPDSVRGVVNIRGEIISVTDLAVLMRLGRVSSDIQVPPAIVVQNDQCVTAMVVDEIGDIADIPAEGIEPPLATIDKLQAEFIVGSVHLDSKIVGLINVDSVLQPIGGTD